LHSIALNTKLDTNVVGHFMLRLQVHKVILYRVLILKELRFISMLGCMHNIMYLFISQLKFTDITIFVFTAIQNNYENMKQYLMVGMRSQPITAQKTEPLNTKHTHRLIQRVGGRYRGIQRTTGTPEVDPLPPPKIWNFLVYVNSNIGACLIPFLHIFWNV
jgi:hypothetical protein